MDSILVIGLLGLIIALLIVAMVMVASRLARLEADRDTLAETIRAEARAVRDEAGAQSRDQRQEIGQTIQGFGTSLQGRLDALAIRLDGQMDRLREENAKKLEEMRVTVDEKLQGTLEKRLGESFALVSQRLELVHKGLGEMQTLATGVGDLKRVLTNVKTRGGWGEMQLGALLDQMLAPDQYEKNVQIKAGGAERVEFAVRMPGQGDTPVLLAIDAKFPVEDYERLMLAYEAGDAAGVDAGSRALEQRIRAEAKRIAGKYIEPPRTTDFAIMYLPTEGLFAEVLRRPGLVSDLQSKDRVAITGPTTLAAFLNSLQVGFRTLAIQARAGEVWQILARAQNEFGKFGEVLDRLDKQLSQAQRTVQEELGKRSRAIERSLRDVEAPALPDPKASD